MNWFSAFAEEFAFPALASWRAQVRFFLLACLLLICAGWAQAQTGVTNTVSITPPAGVINSNPSPSCTGGVCSAADADTVTPSADLSVTKVASVSRGTAGSTFSYVITFANAGPRNAAAVTLTDNLTAAGLTLVSATASTGNSDPPSLDASSTTS